MPPDLSRDDGDGLQHRANRSPLMGLLQRASRLFALPHMPKRSTNVTLLNGAKQFQVHGPAQFLNAYELNVANTYGGNHDLLDIMKPSVSFGALHDSYADDPEHRCRPKTRQYVLKRLQDWIDDITSAERIFWLHGSAGSGKSAIAHTIVDSKGQNTMAATFFFCRSDTDRNNGNRLFMTLAWQLALSIPSIQSHIMQSLNRNPGLPWKSVETQFKELIAQPFQAVMHNAASKAQLPSLVVIIDGIDECPDENLQRRILVVIGDAASNPDVPLRFLISSRLEAHIKRAFDQFKCPVLRIDLRYEKLEELVSFDAIHNSRGQRLACGSISSSHEHTLQQLQGWVDNCSSEPISWLHGPAGSGKSAIAQSIADLNEREKVAATFFFHRSKATRNDGTRIFPTLCWQLASLIPTYNDYIIQYLAQCSFLPRQDIEEQFKELIVRPFGAVAAVRSQDQPLDWVVIIDGVDECAGLQIQQKCLEAIENNVRYRRIPLRFLITSRSGGHVQQTIHLFRCRMRIFSIDLGISPLGIGTSAKPYQNLRIAPTKDREGSLGLFSEPADALALPAIYDPGSASRQMLQQFPSRPTFYGARDAIVALPALNPQDKSEKDAAMGYTNFRAPSLRQGVSSRALHLSSQVLPAPRSRPAIVIPVPSLINNNALAAPPKERPQKASGSSSRYEISTPLKFGSKLEMADIPDVASRNTPSHYRSTKLVPVIQTSPSTPSLRSGSTVRDRLFHRVPVGHLDHDLPNPPATPTPVSRSQPIRSSSRSAASSSYISLIGPPSPGPFDLIFEAPSLSRNEGSSIVQDMGWRRSADGKSKSRDRKLSETPSVARVAEEADENPAWKRDQNMIQDARAETPSEKLQKPEKPEEVFAVHRHKGRWPDDSMDLFDQAKPLPIYVQKPPPESDEEVLYSVPPQQALPNAGVYRIEKVEVAEPDWMEHSQSTRYPVDNAVLMPSRLRRKMSPDGVAPEKVMLRRHSTKPNQRNPICLLRSSDDPQHGDDTTSVPLPRAAPREHVHGSSTPFAETSFNHEQYRASRGRFQSDADESLAARRIRPNIDEHFGRRSRMESMITRGVSAKTSAGVMKRESIDGSRVKETIVVKEAGKPPAQYKLSNCIGRGQFSSVYRALNLSTGQTVAVKQIRLEGLNELEVTELMREVNVCKRLSHPGIVRYEGLTRDDETLSIVLEYAENGSLEQTLKSYGKLNERLVASYAAKILEALHYLHSQDVVHCDLKAANILMTKTGSVKLTDFGVSLNLRAMKGHLKNAVGAQNWMAPEIIELKGASAKSDIWSLACTVIELLTGRPPYGEISNTMTVMFRLVEDKIPPIPEGCSDLARDFLLQCFNKDPVQRPSAEILFEHPWLKQNWGIYKQLRPQDSLPFLRRVSEDLQRSGAVWPLQQSDMPRLYSPSVLKESPNAQSPLEQHFSTSSVLENGFSSREHTFVKTIFNKAILCPLCSTDVKKAAVICSLCGFVSHAKCAQNAPQTCDLRAQFLLSRRARMGSPTSPYYNPTDALGSSRPPGVLFANARDDKVVRAKGALRSRLPKKHGAAPAPRSPLQLRSIRRTEFSDTSASAADQTHSDEFQNTRQSVVSTAMTEGSAENPVKNDMGNFENEQFIYAKLDAPVMPPFRLDFEDGPHVDIKKYLREEFSRIAAMQGLAKTWPGQHVIQDLAHRSCGHFIYANTIVKLISERISNAETLLNLILDLQPRTETPFAHLDVLYVQILKWQPDRVFLKNILALIIVRTSILKGYENLWKNDAVLMNVSNKELQTKLWQICSLLHFMPYIKVHHQSFLDFLQDASCSGQYYISKEEGLRRYLKLITGSLVQYVNQVLNQPEHHEIHHFTPQFSLVVKEYPRRIELPVAEWQEVLQPLLKLKLGSSIPLTEPTVDETEDFEEHIDDTIVIDDSLHNCLSQLLTCLRSPRFQSSPTDMEIMAQMCTVLYFDCAEIVSRIHSVSEAQNLVDVIVNMLDEKYFLDQGDPGVKRKAILLALEIYARIPVLPRSLFLEGSTHFDIEKWNCRSSEIEILCQSALIGKILDIKYIVPVSRIYEEEGKLTFVGCNEYEGRKSLRQWRRTYPSFGTVTQVMLEVAKAFRYLHAMGIILHYDTDSDDIFLDSDLSPTIRFMGYFLLYIVKTPSICLETGSKVLMTREANVFNFGYLFYQTVFNVKIPLEDRVKFKSDFIVQRSKCPTESDIPDYVWKLIQLCCGEDPKRRPTMNEVVEEMETWRLPSLLTIPCPQGVPGQN